MQSCDICSEEFQCPVALPCGHVYCNNCIFRAIDAIKEYSTLHTCPTCRTRYTVASIDPATVPPHLHLHITPSVRQLHLDGPSKSPRRISSTTEIAVENGRLNAENSALRVNCEMWRKRAETHGAAILSLLNAARIAKEQVSKTERERNELQNQCEILKRRLSSAYDQ
ncbi:hypothetical protein BDZ94DRAFT_1158854 [Collybia nuda]|uniref:RING-type domain-containing protein n=1 Tax=Collybia nuda TaxID=64659 RepID=A0A9P5YC53_9AGAR|nr:hypothetical protein BDZ94DRAFT_1158854 [Collybia nuda]